MTPYVIMYCTAPPGEKATEIAEYLVKNRLVACVNIIPAIQSVYTWKGKLCSDGESLLIMKTRKELIKKIEQEIKSIHPYEVPEIIATDIQDGLEEYLKWIAESTI